MSSIRRKGASDKEGGGQEEEGKSVGFQDWIELNGVKEYNLYNL